MEKDISKVDELIEDLKSKISMEIMEELEKAGATIIKSNYDGFSELSKILNKFDAYMDNHNSEVDRITKRYAKDVALEKIHQLDMDLVGEKASVGIDLDAILDKEKKYKKDAISNKLKSNEYKEARREAMDLLIPFGKKFDEETTFDLIKPLIEAKDLSILKALKETANEKTRCLYTTAIRQVEDYISTTHLEMAIRDAKRYLSNPKKGKSLFLLNAIHEYSKKK